jgi:SRSO17 transposase
MSLNAEAVAVRDRSLIPSGSRFDDLRDLSSLCSEVFWSLARADQRRWAEVYVRGLLSVPGRKSIRRICDEVVGYPAEQSLQQFLSQSPWDEREVRRNLATLIATTVRPRAIAFREVAFPKHGANSVAVARQFAPSLGRVLNGQLGIAAFLATDSGSYPVNWRLAMPQCWDEDTKRRTAAGVPDTERHQPWWCYVLDALDELVERWGVPPAPVLVDARHERRLEPLLRGLEARRVHYAVQVSGDCPVRPVRGGAGALAGAVAGPARPGYERPMNVADLAATVPAGNRTVVGWSGPGRGGCSAFALTPLVSLPPSQQIRTIAAGASRGRHLMAEWPLGQHRPQATWITNLRRARVPNLVGLVKLGPRVDRDTQRLTDECGLQHFEGRSFRGWHHHVTLVSAAHTYRLLRELEAEG